jgi:PST family polysaccharide transporter
LTAPFEPKDRAALKGASINGLAITFAAQFARFGMQFVYQVIIARLLTPREFGLVAMASPILAFVALFADFGLTQTTVQRRSINQAELSFLFWSNCALSCALAIVTAAFAPLVGWFFAEPDVSSITMALGALFLLSGLSAQHTALLNRRLAFGKLAVVSLVSFGVGAGVGVVAAIAGLSFWAIVIGQAATSLVSLPLAWAFTRWIPSRPRWVADAGKLLGFGGNITTFNFLNYFARNLDNVLIGRFAGGAALGLYDRAYKLLLLPLTQINGPFTSVAMPLLARTRDEPAVYRRAYLQMLEVILLLTYPGVIFAVCTSHQLIVTVLGTRWAGVAPIFAVLGIGALFAPIGSSTGWLFITQERTREMRNWGMLSSLLFVASFVIGLPWGPLGVAISYITAGAFQGPVVWWLTTRTGPVSFPQLLTAIYPCVVGAAVTALAELGLGRILPPGLPTLVLLLFIAYSTFIGVLAFMPRGRAILKGVAMQGRQLVARVSEQGSGRQDAKLPHP